MSLKRTRLGRPMSEDPKSKPDTDQDTKTLKRSQSQRRREFVGYVMLALIVAILVLVAVLVKTSTDAGIVLLTLGAALSAVVLLQIIWTLVGGEPMQTEVHRLSKETTELRHHFRKEIGNATHALRDLDRTGIERLHARRGATKSVNRWLRLGAEAETIDLLGLTMFHEWLIHPPLRKLLLDVAKSERGKVRVLILPSPEADLADLKQADSVSPSDVNYYARTRQTGEEGGSVLTGYLTTAHERLKELETQAGPPKFEVRYLTKCTAYCMMVGIDTYVYVAPYLSSGQGEYSFAFEASDPRGTLFKMYRAEFQAVWDAEGDGIEPLDSEPTNQDPSAGSAGS
jgi:hypothetical protein